MTQLERGIVTAALLATALAGSATASAPKSVRYVDSDDATGSSQAVIVKGIPLAYAGFVRPLGRRPEGTTRGTAKEQIANLLDLADQTLRVANSGMNRAAKLNVYLASDDIGPLVRSVLAERFKTGAKPATTFVSGQLADNDALVALDVIGACDDSANPSAVVKQRLVLEDARSFNWEAVVATMPAGSMIYVSGQAEKGKDTVEMTRKTMESLHATLSHLGIGLNNVVQVKSFLGPIRDSDQAHEEITRFFGEVGKVVCPPHVVLEWTSTASIEIELVAASGMELQGADSDTVEFITPPGMTASPVFSRVARTYGDELIFISGLYGNAPSDRGTEVTEIFDQLRTVLEKTGSDFRHLAKATYYVSAEETSARLNELRPRYYDPKRPPAASKAPVRGTGLARRTITLDMIAVPLPVRE